MIMPIEREPEWGHAIRVAHVRALRDAVLYIVQIDLVGVLFSYDEHIAEGIEGDLRGPNRVAAQGARRSRNRVQAPIVAHVEPADVAGTASVQYIQQVATERDADRLFAARWQLLDQYRFVGKH